MSVAPFSRPRKRTISFEKTNDCFDIVDNLTEIIAKTPCLDKKVSFSMMESPTISANAVGVPTNPFQNTANDDFWNSLDLFNDDAMNTSSDCHHIKEEIHEMDFAITKIKDEQFKDLGDLTDMWPFGADDNMDGSGVEDLFGTDLVDSIINSSTKQEEQQQVIQSDLMWSSTLDKDTTLGAGFETTLPFKRGRRRDVSITLSECAEGLLTVKDMELMSSSPLLGSSPMIGGHGNHNAFFMDTPLASSESDTETGVSGDSEEEEEIDVEKVQDHDELSSSRTRVHYRKHHNNQHHKQNHTMKNGNNAAIPPGRSLLKSRHNQQHKQQQRQTKQEQQTQQQQRSSTPSIDHMFGDHSYFLVRPAPGSTGSDSKDYSDVYSDDEGRENNDGNRFGGMLTPTESGDEAEDRLKGTITATTISTPSNIDKRKIAQAVQSLIKNRSLNASDGQTAKAAAHALTSHKSTDVKFRFRMRFKSTNPKHQTQKSLLNINNRPLSSNNNDQDHHRIKRRSASKNPHCPTPPLSSETETLSSSEQTTIDSITTGTGTMLTTPASNRHQHRQEQMSPYYISTSSSTAAPIQRHQSTFSSSSGNNNSSRRSLLTSNNNPNRLSQEDKCREIRDLHNSMERQRRVDLRKNFDMLKVCVPDLADVEKASKLNILNKAADYCRLLVSLDTKFKKELDKEEQKNAIMRKKLESLCSQLDNNSTRLSSGRVLQSRNRLDL
jgi:hypothetical protein